MEQLPWGQFFNRARLKKKDNRPPAIEGSRFKVLYLESETPNQSLETFLAI